MFTGLLVGIAFGILLQRTQFCFVSGFRRLLFEKNFQFLTALFIAVSVQSVGFFTLAEFDLLTIPQTPLPIFATVVGGLLFGVGMVLSNCCGSGAWFRSAEGALGSFLALVAFAITLASTQSGSLHHFIRRWTQQSPPWDNIYLTLAISPWWLVGILVFFTLILFFRREKFSRAENLSFFNRTFKSDWNPYLGGLLMGGLGVLAWYLSAQTGRNYGYGIAVPSANVVQYLVIGQQRYLNWGSLFVLGIPLGAFIMAKLSGDFQLRMPEPKEALRRIAGGVTMGFGAALAGGCTVTNALVATAYFSWQGWLATGCILMGCWGANKWLVKR
ncbi:YeeE/YedE family protein [Rodentibacter trehalosifermentans]|uniref:ABC transporter permease n=1 Tax=Rodentibacter trehalosifermentans TaxID=1908263 RepID=A0A1V3IVC4_9PAST|nr:YeeE/YedE family protein [Rodentibacter trehalosifermentans]OOF45862.1 ABC transporter permease [Rodentibacter trehalosifermentans]OOF50219.1 ABC transporter permease [Rodentibacter trehalosifermentans]OOF52917.1 ABC transporter permease [Rodentibacter trehalosifermentans]